MENRLIPHTRFLGDMAQAKTLRHKPHMLCYPFEWD